MVSKYTPNFLVRFQAIVSSIKKGPQTMTEYVTRVVKGSLVKFRCVNLEHHPLTVTELSVYIDKRYKNDEDPLKDVIRLYKKRPNIKIIDIVSVTTSEDFLGIPFEDFIKQAVRLDRKTRKPIINDKEENTCQK